MLTNIIVAMCVLSIVKLTHFNHYVVIGVIAVASVLAVEWVKEKNNWKH